MNITKFHHSCLLVEDQGKVVLIDPGNYTEQEQALNISKLNQLDYLLITHEHMDHFSLPLVKHLVKKFPDVKIITTKSIVDQLAKENIAASTEGDGNIKVEVVPHEKVWAAPMCENIMVTVFGKLAHPGDSHTFTTSADILALPIAAPWGSTTDAVMLAEKLHPKVIIPIHDYMLKDNSRRMMYQWIKGYLGSKGIDLKDIESGQEVEIM